MGTAATHKITLIRGDGIGPEVSAAVVEILEAAGKATGVSFDWDRFDAGADAYEKTREYIPKALYESIEGNRVALKGPVTTPVGGGFSSINVTLRKRFDLYANLRPVKNLPGLSTKYPGIDLVIVRENTEGLYVGLEQEIVPGVATALKVTTEKGSTRIARFAFEYARKMGRKKIHAIHKANIMKKTDGLFIACSKKVAEEYPEIAYAEHIVDNTCMQLVMNPWQYDVLLTENLYGDILSDLCSGLIGGLGLVPGANLGKDCAIFEAVHGSAPDIAGKGLGESDGSARERGADAAAPGRDGDGGPGAGGDRRRVSRGQVADAGCRRQERHGGVQGSGAGGDGGPDGGAGMTRTGSMTRIGRWMLAATFALPMAAGCKPDAAARKAEDIDRGVSASATARTAGVPVDPATAGSVSGKVSFTGKAPARVKIDMTMDPVCEMKAGDNYSEQFVTKGDGLGNVFVYVKSGPAAAMHAAPGSTAPVVLDQRGCRYTPHVIGVMAGQQVEFRNSDPTMHNIHTMPVVAGNEVIDVSQGPNGEPQRRVFSAPELMLPVRCNNHPWMNAFINVSATPFFAVTGEDGRFDISGLPAGDYVLGAVHEKLGEQTFPVTVTAQGTAKAEFRFRMK